MPSQPSKIKFNSHDRLPNSQCTGVGQFHLRAALIWAALLFISFSFSRPCLAMSNSCRSVFAPGPFERIFAKIKSSDDLVTQATGDVDSFVAGLQTSSMKLKSILNRKFTSRYWQSAESVLLAQKFRLVFEALDGGFVDRLTPDRYFEFETAQLSGAFSIYFEGKSSAKESLVIDIQEVRIKSNGQVLNDGQSTGALSPQFARLMVAITRTLYESKLRYPELRAAQIKASVVNVRLKTSLQSLGFTEEERRTPNNQIYWFMSTLIRI